jgi:hypothetical protein
MASKISGLYLHVEYDNETAAPAPVWLRHASAVPLSRRVVCIRQSTQSNSDLYHFSVFEPEPERFFDVNLRTVHGIRIVVSTHPEFPSLEGRVFVSVRFSKASLLHCLRKSAKFSNCVQQESRIEIRLREWREPGIFRFWVPRIVCRESTLRDWLRSAVPRPLCFPTVFEAFSSRHEQYPSRSGTILTDARGSICATQESALAVATSLRY